MTQPSAPPPAAPRGARLACPLDGVELQRAAYEADVEVDRCPRCGGMWLHRGDLERVEETLEHVHADALRGLPDDVAAAYRKARQSAEPPRCCPVDGAELDRREHGYCSQILVDVCPRCRGVWVDRGELEALEVFFERSVSDRRRLRTAFWVGARGGRR